MRRSTAAGLRALAFSFIFWTVQSLCWMVPHRETWLAGRAQGNRAKSCISCRYAPIQWVEVKDRAPANATAGSTVLPIFPLSIVNWPGAQVILKTIHPFQKRMYTDILESGSRRIVVPFTKSLPDGKVRFNKMGARDHRIHSVGSVLYLDELQEVKGEDMYLARHKVEGRCRIKQLLNPSALFEVGPAGIQKDYLRAEVELLETSQDMSNSDDEDTVLLRQTWEGLRKLAERTGEPRLSSPDLIEGPLSNSSTWHLAYLWQQLQQQVKKHREKARVASAIDTWISDEQNVGRLPSVMPEQIDASQLNLPPLLLDHAMKAHKSDGTDLDDERDFWEPYLRILATDSSAKRVRILLDEALREVEVTRTRALLRDMLGGGEGQGCYV